MKRYIMLVTLILALAALSTSLAALFQLKSIRQLALSEIVVEEHNSLSTPVLEEEKGALSFVSLYDISITNVSGPAVSLSAVRKSAISGSFLTLLRGEEILNTSVESSAFISKSNCRDIQANPGVLREVMKSDMGSEAVMDMVIAPGETKMIHIGVAFRPYDADKQPIAMAALVSFDLLFDNGKTNVFRRAFPIYPVN